MYVDHYSFSFLKKRKTPYGISKNVFPETASMVQYYLVLIVGVQGKFTKSQKKTRILLLLCSV